MLNLAEVRAGQMEIQCCRPSASLRWRRPVDVGSMICRWWVGYRQRAAFKALDDHLLDDIGIDSGRLRRMTHQRELATRRLCRIANGWFI